MDNLQNWKKKAMFQIPKRLRRIVDQQNDHLD